MFGGCGCGLNVFAVWCELFVIFVFLAFCCYLIITLLCTCILEGGVWWGSLFIVWVLMVG